MHPSERRHRSAVGTFRTLARWGLLGAVIAAVLALHVLTAEHTPGQHVGLDALPTESHSLVLPTGTGAGAAIDPAAGDEPGVAGPAADGLDPGGSGEFLLGCVLFLAIAGPALLLALLRGRRAVLCLPSGPGTLVRGLPVPVRTGVPRLALCVIRI